jgi:DNA excision repair protein ERCC-5
LFDADIIQKELQLDREKLILMALFLGSDYTLGIKGIGIVNAYEIVSTFDNFESLKRFKEWASLPDIFLENHQKFYENISEKEKNFKLFH